MSEPMYLPTLFVKQKFAMTTDQSTVRDKYTVRVPDQRVDFRVAAAVAVGLDTLMQR